MKSTKVLIDQAAIIYGFVSIDHLLVCCWIHLTQLTNNAMHL